MKLEDKFLPYCDNKFADKEVNALNCADVANEHAISFAQWIQNNPVVLKWDIYFKNGIGGLLEYFNENYN